MDERMERLFSRDVARPEGPVRNCGSCGGGDLALVLDLGEQPLPQAVPGRVSKRYPLRLVKCPTCTLVQLDYIAPQAEVFPVDYPYTTGNTKALRDHFAEQARLVAGMLHGGVLVVDIGGNDGTMLKALRREAPDAVLLLIEPTNQALRCDDPSIEVVQDYFTSGLAADLWHTHGTAKVITASNVFGHVPDPHDFLDGVQMLLAADGTLIIDNQDWRNVVNGLQIDTVYHEHLRYYSPASLSWLLAQHGLLVESWTRLGMHGGSFRVVARREQQFLDERAKGLAVRLHLMVETAAEEGPVYAVTAPTRATPLVNYARIGPFLTCACEVAGSEKIGAVIPGTDVPIVDEEKLFQDQPPYALILAWDIADGLIPVLRERGYKGTFLVPLPEPVIAGG